MNYEIDFSNEYLRAVAFNQKVGKLPTVVTQMDILRQQRLVDEEVGEWLEELEKEDPTPNLLKELCDVFVVMSYLDFLQLMEVDEEISSETASQVMKQVWENFTLDAMTEQDYLACAKGIREMSNLKLMLLGTKYSLIDIRGALKEVLDNNDLKVYGSSCVANHQLSLLGGKDKYFVDCNTYNGENYYCVKRIEDGKVMKGVNHPKVSMNVFFGVDNEDV